MSHNCPKCGSYCDDYGPTSELGHLWFCVKCEDWVDDVINLDEIRAFIHKVLGDGTPYPLACLKAVVNALELSPDKMRSIGLRDHKWSFYDKEKEDGSSDKC